MLMADDKPTLTSLNHACGHYARWEFFADIVTVMEAVAAMLGEECPVCIARAPGGDVGNVYPTKLSHLVLVVFGHSADDARVFAIATVDMRKPENN